MAKPWKKFFEQDDFEIRPAQRDGVAAVFRSRTQSLYVYPEPGNPWQVKLSPQKDLCSEPNFVHSDLLGASQLGLYNEAGDEQARLCALRSDLCVMLSDPTDRFAENGGTPEFYDAEGAEIAHCARGPEEGQMWSLILLTADGRGFRAGLVALKGERGCVLFRMRPHN